MNEILIADGKRIESMPRKQWESELSAAPQRMKVRLAFMTPEHHTVRRFAVSELPRRGKAISVAEIAESVSLPRDRVKAIVDELEKALFFLVRTKDQVSWAFPVTVERTPHALAFSSGERCFAA